MSKGYHVPGLPSREPVRHKKRGCACLPRSVAGYITNAHRLQCAGSWLKPCSTRYGMPYQRACVECQIKGGEHTETSLSKWVRVTSVRPMMFSRNLAQPAISSVPSRKAPTCFSAMPCSFSRKNSACPCNSAKIQVKLNHCCHLMPDISIQSSSTSQIWRLCRCQLGKADRHREIAVSRKNRMACCFYTPL